jgi:Ca2+-binding EF-hand superfamily protein
LPQGPPLRNPLSLGRKSVMKLFAILTLALWCGLSANAKADDSVGIEGSPEALFKKLDTNADGKLTASEIPKEQAKFFERLLRIGDTNKDGVLSREEFDAAMQKAEKPVTDISKTPVVDGTAAGKPKRDPAQIFEKLDKNKDGKLTSDEVESTPRIKALFDRLGKNEMTLDDLKTALQGAGNAKKSAKRIAKNEAKKAAKKGTLQASPPKSETMNGKSEKMSGASEEPSHGLPAFAKELDTNHDGHLSREELSKAVASFDKLDRNHDGVLDANELSEIPVVPSTKAPAITPAAALKRMGKKGGKIQKGNLAQIFQKADANGDGKLSMEESPPFLKKRFAKIDTNSDGFLDKSELEIWIHHHHKLAGRTPEGTDPSDSTKPPEKRQGPSGV